MRIQLGVESYQKKLNITKPQQDCANNSFKEPYTTQSEPQGVIYDKQKRKRLMRTNELYKFSDGTLKYVRDTLHERLLNFRLRYNKGMERRKWTEKYQRWSHIMMIKIDEQLLERRIMRNLKRLDGGRELKTDYRVMLQMV
ncbi:hypothetical protein Tco_1368780 [Tanacetum coccineum]